MKVLVRGCETAEQVEILLKLTGISSDNIKQALRAYLVEGFPASRCYARFGVTQQHFSRALAKLNQKAELAMQFAQYLKTNTNKVVSKI